MREGKCQEVDDFVYGTKGYEKSISLLAKVNTLLMYRNKSIKIFRLSNKVS